MNLHFVSTGSTTSFIFHFYIIIIIGSNEAFFLPDSANCRVQGGNSIIDFFERVIYKKDTCQCNDMNPNCDLTATEAQLMYLTPYSEFPTKIQEIVDAFAFPQETAQIQAGPLIRNNYNDGIIDIDVPLACGDDISDKVNCNVCDGTELPTIREAVICTVTNDPLGFTQRGNRNSSNVGFSNKGRNIYAIRMGNFNAGKRSLLLSQLHGNEPPGTEAFFDVAKQIATGSHPDSLRLLTELDMLFVFRVNVDGGEPTANNLETDYADYYNGIKNFTDDAYFFRENVYPDAGGNRGATDGNPLSEDDFFGIVGRGYNLNRYIYANLKSAIRPVEAQAIVATLHAFRPRTFLDAHGDVPKVVCNLNLLSLKLEAVLNVLPSIECLWPAPAKPTVTSARPYSVEASVGCQDMEPESDVKYTHAIAEYVAESLEKKLVGHVQRFSQIQLGTGSLNNGDSLAGGANVIGALGLYVETLNFGLAYRPAVNGYEIEDGEIKAINTIDLHTIEPCYLIDAICIHKKATLSFLKAAMNIADQPSQKPLIDEYCIRGITHNLVGLFPSILGWSGTTIKEDRVVVPSAGQFGIPTEILGTCSVDSIPYASSFAKFILNQVNKILELFGF